MKAEETSRWVSGLEAIDRRSVAVVGGKGANLGELLRIDGVRVPAGFCVTTDAFRSVLAAAPSIDDRLARLSRLRADDLDGIRTESAALREAIAALTLPDDIAAAITGSLERLGERRPYAVRSSATAEDLPDASSAGVHDTFLDVVGRAAVLERVRRCWASLFTERAVAYRLRGGVDHRQVQMAVVVQRMVAARAAGVLFTVDPLTSNRRVAAVEASAGLGEALVSGRLNPDRYRVRDGGVVARSIAGERPALRDAEVVELVAMGRRIAAHFGAPQDLEWCLDDEGFHFVQSRPVTALFPIPALDDGEKHVFLSVGHQQMMTDPMRPLGLSVWQMTALRPMYEAAGRLFVDVTPGLRSPAIRRGLLELFGRSDPLTRDAIETLLDRGDFVPVQEGEAVTGPPAVRADPPAIACDPAVVAELVERDQASIAALRRDLASVSGAPLFERIEADLAALKRSLVEPVSQQAVMAGMEATWWLNERLEAWLGERQAADALTLSAPHNVTAEMGLALLEVADVIRRHPEVVAFLRGASDDGFLDALPSLPGGQEARDAIEAYLERYGARCVGEIDITRPRWRERPSALVPAILADVEHFAAGEATRRFERGLQEARRKEHEVLERLRALPDGEAKAAATKERIDRLRTFIGYREYPKFGIVSRYFAYKQALLAEAEALVRAEVLRAAEDVFFLTFEELREVVRARQVDARLLAQRKGAFRSYHSLRPPRVFTSDGEVIAGAYRREGVPAGALVGLAVSAGTVEGRARVVLDPADAELEPGDVLVTTATDPCWAPVFVAIAGLVTEVGGLMTHGAVIAREYGVPAVVGVEDATRRIRDGQRIRVHGAEGYVEVLG